MLQQALAGGAEQQASEAAATTGTDHDDVVIIAGLGQRANRRARHDLLVDLQIRMGFLKRLDTHFQIILERGHHPFVVGTLHVRHRGNNIQLGIPCGGEIRRDLQRLQTPLGFVGADGHLGDGVVQVHQIAVIVSVRHHYDRAVCIRRQTGAGRAQQTFRQTAFAAIADDDEIVVTRQFHEYGSRIARNNKRGSLNTLLVGDGLGLRKNLLRVAMGRIVIPHGGVCRVEGDSGIARQRVCAYDLQRQSRMLRIVRSPPSGLIAGVGSINTNEDCLVVNHGRPP